MFHRLVSHNPDLSRLVDKGYAVGFDDGYLIIRDIPYLDAGGDCRTGSIITKLVFVDELTVALDDHQVFFAGGVPYGLEGIPVSDLGGGPATLALSPENADVRVERSFSNKPVPSGKFADFFEKIESYVTHISGPAIERHGASPLTFKVNEVLPDSVFKYHDTLTSRAEILDLARKFESETVAVVGLGGTGAYVLDFLVKTPVLEIRAFDNDVFHVHTAFRSPGRLVGDELGKPKAEVYSDRYDGFRHGLRVEELFVGEHSRDAFQGVTFAFVCVDRGPSRAAVFDLLIELRIPFIDVGMGLARKEAGLKGSLRTTYYSPEEAATLKERDLAPLTDAPDREYRTNIQIAELNALNAALALIRYKQLRGFYVDDLPVYQAVFNVRDLSLIKEWEL